MRVAHCLSLLGVLASAACAEPQAPRPPRPKPPAPSISSAPSAAPQNAITPHGPPFLEGDPRPAPSRVALSPSGQRVALDLGNKTIEVWDTATGARIATKTLPGAAGVMAFSPDGRSLTVGSIPIALNVAPDPAIFEPIAFAPSAPALSALNTWARKLGGRLRMVDNQVGVEGPLPGYTTAFSIAPAFAAVAAVLDHNKVSVFSLQRSAAWDADPFFSGGTNFGSAAPGQIDIRFGTSAARAVLISWSLVGVQERGEARLVDMATGRVIASLGPACPPYPIRWSDNGRLAVNEGCFFDRPHVVEAETGREIPLPAGSVAAIDASGRTVALTGGGVRVVDVAGSRPPFVLSRDTINTVQLSRGGTRLIAVSAFAIDVWALDRGARAARIEANDAKAPMVDRAERVAVIPASSGFYVVDLEAATVRGPVGEGTALALSPSGDGVLLAKDTRVRMVDLDGRARFDIEPRAAGKAFSAAIASMGGDRIYVASEGGWEGASFAVLDAKDGRIIGSKYSSKITKIPLLAASPDGLRVVARIETEDGRSTDVLADGFRRTASLKRGQADAWDPSPMRLGWSADSKTIFSLEEESVVARRASNGGVLKKHAARGVPGSVLFDRLLKKSGAFAQSDLDALAAGVPPKMKVVAASDGGAVRALDFDDPRNEAPVRPEGIWVLGAKGRVLRLVSRSLGATQGWAVLDDAGPYDASPGLLGSIRMAAPDGSPVPALAAGRTPGLLSQILPAGAP